MAIANEDNTFMEALGKSSCIVIASFIQRDPDYQMRSSSAKALKFTCNLTMFFIFAAYTACLTTDMTCSQKFELIKSWQELLDSEYQLTIWKDSATHELFENAPKNSDRGIVYEQALRGKEDALLTNGIVDEYER